MIPTAGISTADVQNPARHRSFPTWEALSTGCGSTVAALGAHKAATFGGQIHQIPWDFGRRSMVFLTKVEHDELFVFHGGTVLECVAYLYLFCKFCCNMCHEAILNLIPNIAKLV